MPDDRRFSDEEIENSLRDLGARVEYPATPDVASTVRRKLDEEERPAESRRTLRWPPFLAPRWTAVAAALVVVCILALSPTLRSTLSGPFAPQAGSQAGSAAKPESGASEDRHKQGAEVAPQEAGAPAPGKPEAAAPCPSPAIEAVPSRAAAGEKFRLHGHDFSSGCGGTPSGEVTILFRQDGRAWRLTTLDAGRDLALEATLRVPAGAEPGPARVQAVLRSGERTEESFVVLDYRR